MELGNALEIFHSTLRKMGLDYGDIDKIISKKYDQIVAKNLAQKKKLKKHEALLQETKCRQRETLHKMQCILGMRH